MPFLISLPRDHQFATAAEVRTTVGHLLIPDHQRATCRRSTTIGEAHSSRRRASVTTQQPSFLPLPSASQQNPHQAHGTPTQRETPGPYIQILPRIIMVASTSSSKTCSSTTCRNKPHLTVRLVLELMAADCCASQRRRTGPDAALAPVVEVNEESLRAALHRCLLAASCLHLNESAGSDEGLVSSMPPAMGTVRHDRSCGEQSVGPAGSWGEEQWKGNHDYLEEDRGRLGAAARSRDLSLDERVSALADHREECCGGSSWSVWLSACGVALVQKYAYHIVYRVCRCVCTRPRRRQCCCCCCCC